jgi:integrase
MPRLKKRADGRYQANVVMGYDAEGKTIIKRVYGNTEAELTAAKNNAKKLAGLGDFSTATVGEWLDEWLRIRQMDVDEETLSERTYDTYDDVIRLHLKPKLGPIRMQSLQPANIRSIIKTKLKNGLSGRRVQYIYTVLNMALTQAENDRAILWNPCKAVKKPIAAKRQYIVITQTQYDTLIEAVSNSSLQPLTALAWDTGMRLGELLGLTWSAIDFKKATITVAQTVRRTKTKGVHLSTTLKSANANRVVPLTASAAAALKAHKKRQAEHRLSIGLKYHSEHDLVFPLLDGSPQDPSTASSDWGKIKSKLGFPANLHFHDLRHTYASTLEEMDVSVKKIQLLLGHASATFTMDTYIHKTETMMDGVKEKLEKRNKTK